MSEEERIIEQAKFRATKLVKEYGVSLTFSGYDKVVAEIINSINWYKDFVKESDYSFARSQAIEFVEDTINIIELINHKLMVVEDVVKGNEGDIITGVRGDLYSLIDALKQKGMEI